MQLQLLQLKSKKRAINEPIAGVMFCRSHRKSGSDREKGVGSENVALQNWRPRMNRTGDLVIANSDGRVPRKLPVLRREVRDCPEFLLRCRSCQPRSCAFCNYSRLNMFQSRLYP